MKDGQKSSPRGGTKRWKEDGVLSKSEGGDGVSQKAGSRMRSGRSVIIGVLASV